MLGIDVLAMLEPLGHDTVVQSHGEKNASVASLVMGSISFIVAVDMRLGRTGVSCNFIHRRFIHAKGFVG
jgi:hypothetical protein